MRAAASLMVTIMLCALGINGQLLRNVAPRNDNNGAGMEKLNNLNPPNVMTGQYSALRRKRQQPSLSSSTLQAQIDHDRVIQELQDVQQIIDRCSNHVHVHVYIRSMNQNNNSFFPIDMCNH